MQMLEVDSNELQVQLKLHWAKQTLVTLQKYFKPKSKRTMTTAHKIENKNLKKTSKS